MRECDCQQTTNVTSILSLPHPLLAPSTHQCQSEAHSPRGRDARDHVSVLSATRNATLVIKVIEAMEFQFQRVLLESFDFPDFIWENEKAYHAGGARVEYAQSTRVAAALEQTSPESII